MSNAITKDAAATEGCAFVCQQTFIVLGIATPFTTDSDARRIQNGIARRTSRIVAREPVSTQYLSEWSKAVARGETPILPNDEMRDRHLEETEPEKVTSK